MTNSSHRKASLSLPRWPAQLGLCAGKNQRVPTWLPHMGRAQLLSLKEWAFRMFPFRMFITVFHMSLINLLKTPSGWDSALCCISSLPVSFLVPREFLPQFVPLCLQTRAARIEHLVPVSSWVSAAILMLHPRLHSYYNSLC